MLLLEKMAGAEDQDGRKREREPAQHKSSDQCRADSFTHSRYAVRRSVPSSRVRKRCTRGSAQCASSSLGLPPAIMVRDSPSKKTLLLPIAKMLASSCETTTTVAPRLSRRSRIRL